MNMWWVFVHPFIEAYAELTEMRVQSRAGVQKLFTD